MHVTSPLAQPNVREQSLTVDVVDDDDVIEIRDFTISRKFVPFRIDGDVFHAYAIMGGALMQQLMNAGEGLRVAVGGNDANGTRIIDLEPIARIFDKLLEPSSATRFRERLFATDETAIDIKRQLTPIIYMLLEEFGLRPTRPSSDSLSGSPSEIDGTPSTGGAPNVEWTPPSS